MNTNNNSIVLPTNSNELSQVLLAMSVNNTLVVQHATKVLKKFLKNHECVLPMVEQIATSQHIIARQMSAVLLRSKINIHWRKLDGMVQEKIKDTLLNCLRSESKNLVRLSIAGLITAIAKHAIPANQWNNLLNILLEMSGSQVVHHREIAMMLFCVMCDNIGSSLRQHFPTLQTIFIKGLEDPQSEVVRIQAAKALGALVEYLNTTEEIERFKSSIPPLLKLAHECLLQQYPNEDIIVVIFEVFETLASSPIPVLSTHMKSVTEFTCEVAATRSLTISFRDSAVQYILSIISNKTISVLKENFVDALLRLSFSMITEPYDDDMMDNSQITPQNMAINILDNMIEYLPRKYIFEPCINQAMHLVKSNNEHERKGGILILAVMAENCTEQLIDYDLEKLLHIILERLNDPHQIVRSAACVTLTQFAEHMQDDLVEYHSIVLPNLFLVLDKSGGNPSVVRKGCVAIDSFVQHLGDEILPYLEQLMGNLLQLLTTNNIVVQETVIGAIRSIARTSGNAFDPYFDTTIAIMKEIMSSENDEHIILRSKATECIGAIGAAVGKEKFKPYTRFFTDLTLRGMKLDSFTLKEAAHQYFAFICEMLHEEFNVLLPTYIPIVLSSLESTDGLVTSTSDEMFQTGASAEFDSDSENEELVNVSYSIRTGALEEKISALQALADIIHLCKKSILPYIPIMIEHLDSLSDYLHPSIRQLLLVVYGEMVASIHDGFPTSGNASKGENVQIDAKALDILNHIMIMFVKKLSNDTSKEVVAAAADGLQQAANLYGLSLFQNYMDNIIKAIVEILNETSPCQLTTEHDDEFDAEKDHDEIMIDHVIDFISTLAEVCKGSFSNVLSIILQPLLRFWQPHRHFFDRSMVIGVLADIGNGMESSFEPFARDILPLAIEGAQNEIVQIRRNSCFCLGIILLYGGVGIRPNIPQILEIFNVICSNSHQLLMNQQKLSNTEVRELEGISDNICSAIAKLISAHSDILPLVEVVNMFVSCLPLKRDFDEAKYVYPCLVHLFSEHPDITMPHLNHIVGALSKVLGAEYLFDEYQIPLITLCKSLISQCGPQMEHILKQLPKDDHDNFVRIVCG